VKSYIVQGYAINQRAKVEQLEDFEKISVKNFCKIQKCFTFAPPHLRKNDKTG